MKTTIIYQDIKKRRLYNKFEEVIGWISENASPTHSIKHYCEDYYYITKLNPWNEKKEKK